MKKLLAAMFLALLMVGCGESSTVSDSADLTGTAPKKDSLESAVDWSKLQDRSGVTHLPNTDKPFSGYAKRTYENEQVEVLAELKDGYVVRLKQWQENGTPRWDVGFIEGKIGVEGEGGMPWSYARRLGRVGHGSYTEYHENGQKKVEGNFKDGNKDGLWTLWHENGQTKEEGNLKGGKMDGLWTEWYENGQTLGKVNLKDDKLLSAVAWKPNGEKCPVTNVVDGNGVVVEYNEDGTEKKRTTFKDGKQVASSRTKGERPLDIEPSGDEKFYELKDLITNLGGPVKARYIDIQLKMEGLAGDFEKILEQNEHRVRDKALTILGNYTYEDAQLDGFQERVLVDLKKGFSSVLRKYRDGESDLIR